ncbi:MAG: DUF2254 domain-containing protein [Myxococcales bacterium]|nr:DUF2254 domain-containing protein [Myxococcales bacterium]
MFSAASARRPRALAKRLWLVPIAVLASIALVGFAGFYLLDIFVTGGGHVADPGGALRRYVMFEPSMITDALPSLAAMTAAVLGIVITVVSIVVQLSSERYTGVARMFLRDRVNVLVMAYFVVACVCGVFLSLSVREDFVPRAAVLAMMAATALGLVVMLPYFAYVFRFLEPTNLIARIRQEATRELEQGATAQDTSAISDAQVRALDAMEELTDITSNSISGKDKIIASRAVDAIKDYVLEYLDAKARLEPRWFQIGEGIRGNPDFVAMDPESLAALEGERTWFEWKALRQYLGISAEAQSAMPDINYLIAIDTRYIGEAALARGDRPLVELAFRFLNSYLRASLNARAVRTAYNVLNQYRLLVETMVQAGEPGSALAAVRHMVYYGRTSFDMQLGFVTETVAYDVSALCEFAHARQQASQQGGGADRHELQLDGQMLALLLELDQPLRAKRQESALQGIRKAQVKLACYYLSQGESERAGLIAADMAGEEPQRLRAIHDQLLAVDSKEFWEIIDRGRNFEYMPPAHRAQLAGFFASVAAARSAERDVAAPASSPPADSSAPPG